MKVLSYINRILLALIVGISFIILPLNTEAKAASTLRELRAELSKLQAQKKSNENEKKSSQTEIKNKTAAIDEAYSEIKVAENAKPKFGPR